MTWGGLRGAVGLALAIQVRADRAGGVAILNFLGISKPEPPQKSKPPGLVNHFGGLGVLMRMCSKPNGALISAVPSSKVTDLKNSIRGSSRTRCKG